jgi:prophage maintenance system killer protein
MGIKELPFRPLRSVLRLNGYKLLFQDLEAYNWLMKLYDQGGLNRTAIEVWLRQHAHLVEEP